VTPTIIRNNYFKASDTSMFGIDLDDGSTNYYCTKNLCIGGGFKMQRGRFNHFINNVVVGGGTIDIHDPMPQNGDSVMHNIIAGREFADWCCSWAGLNANGTALAQGVVSRGSIVDSNCYYGYGSNPRVYSWAGWGASASRAGTACTWDQWVAGGCDVHSRVADPLFVDPANGNYQVKAGSPALAMGFKNFPMDSFGVLTVPCVGTSGQFKGSTFATENRAVQLRYSGKRLSISHHGRYALTITTVSGKVAGRFSAKGDASFILNLGAGMYIANLKTEKGFEAKRFIIN
jgi:hypothetical protein